MKLEITKEWGNMQQYTGLYSSDSERFGYFYKKITIKIKISRTKGVQVSTTVI